MSHPTRTSHPPQARIGLAPTIIALWRPNHRAPGSRDGVRFQGSAVLEPRRNAGAILAEHSNKAFGHYLRVLRERRHLSLRQVAELTASSPEPIDKGTLSRLERGLQVPSIYKLGPICRIYGIAAEALIERMELDREVDRSSLTDVEAKDYAELQRLGREAVMQGARKMLAYACFRAAAAIATDDNRVSAWGNLATVIRSLGKNALALHEWREIEPLVRDSGHRALINERIANCYRCRGEMGQAERFAEAAITLALEGADSTMLAFAQTTRANVAIEQEQWSVAAAHLAKAQEAHRQGLDQPSVVISGPLFEAQTLLMLADCEIHLSNLPRARRLAVAAKRISEQNSLSSAIAYCEYVLGRLDDANGSPEQALARWRKAASLAAEFDHKRLAFTVEVELFRQALRAGDAARARASRRRLERMAPWIPSHVQALREFKQLAENTIDAPRMAAAKGDAHDRISDRRSASDSGLVGLGAKRVRGRDGSAGP